MQDSEYIYELYLHTYCHLHKEYMLQQKANKLISY